MIAPVFLALGLSALLLLAFGDMLGLPAPLVRSLALAILCVVALGVVLLRSTARFGRFLSGDDGIRAPGGGMIAAALVGGTILSLVNAAGVAAPMALLVFFGCFAFGLAVINPPVPDAGPSNGDIQMIRSFSAGLLCLLGLMIGLPAVLAALAEILPLTSNQALVLGLALIGIPVIFGGMASLAALAGMVLLLTLVFVMMPVLLELAIFLRGAQGSALSGIALTFPAAPFSETRLILLESAALGLALAIAARQGRGQATRKGRFSRPVLGLALGAGIVASGCAIWLMLHHILINELAGKPISSWPLWPFDEAIRGWIRLCGQPIASHPDSLRACAQQGIAHAGPLIPDRAMMLPALAIARGWPVLFGILPNFIGVLALAFSVAMLLHAAIVALGSLWSLLRPQTTALRSQRLALMRALALIILAVAANSNPFVSLHSDETSLVLMIGLILLIIVTQVAAMLRSVQHWWQKRKAMPIVRPPTHTDQLLPDAA